MSSLGRKSSRIVISFASFVLLSLLLLLLFWEFFTPALSDDFSWEFKWQQISSSVQDSSLYSVRFLKSCSLNDLCDTTWVVRQADDPFVCFGAKPNKGLSSRSSTRPEVDKETPVRGLEKGTQRRSWRRVTQRGSRHRTAEETSRYEIVPGQWRRQTRWVHSPESTTVSSEEDGQRWVGIPSSL